MRCFLVIQNVDETVSNVEMMENTTIISVNSLVITMQEKTFGDSLMEEKLREANIVFTSSSIVACGNGPYSIKYTKFTIECIRFNINVLNNNLDEL